MLVIHATHYVSPLAEVEFTDVPLTVHLVNGADEPALITGRFRVYNDTTHELIFDSLIAPLSLTKGQEVDVSALTDFSPPAPLDDTYFVLFDGNASNYLVPRGIPIMLGGFYFDVKPGPLGAPPAAHAPTHEQGGADPIDTGDLGTAELDTTLRLAPDGAGGVAWAVPAAVAAQAYSIETDFLHRAGYTYVSAPWLEQVTGGGASLDYPGEPNHPGIHTYKSGTSANSGVTVHINESALLLAGGERFDVWIRPITTTNTTTRTGLHNARIVAANPTNGVYFEIVGTQLVGKTAKASARSTTGTAYTIVPGPDWLHLVIVVNSNATWVDFSVLADDGTVLWTDFLTTNIPTAAGEEVGVALLTDNSGTVALELLDIDLIRLSIERTLVR